MEVPHKYPTSTPQVPHKYGSASIGVFNILKVLFFNGEQGRKTIQEELGLKDVNHFRANYIDPALVEGLIRMKYPDSPNHPRQKYLITEKGKELLKQK